MPCGYPLPCSAGGRSSRPAPQASRAAAWDGWPAIDGEGVRPYGPRPLRAVCRHLGTVAMPLTDLVAPNAILPALRANNKKQVIQELAAKAAELTGQND